MKPPVILQCIRISLSRNYIVSIEGQSCQIQSLFNVLYACIDLNKTAQQYARLCLSWRHGWKSWIGGCNTTQKTLIFILWHLYLSVSCQISKLQIWKSTVGKSVNIAPDHNLPQNNITVLKDGAFWGLSKVRLF